MRTFDRYSRTASRWEKKRGSAAVFILIALTVILVVVAGFASWVQSHRRFSVQSVANVRGRFINDAAIEVARQQYANTPWNQTLNDSLTYQIGIDTVTVTVVGTGWP